MSDGGASAEARARRARDLVRYLATAVDHPFATVLAVEHAGDVDAVLLQVEPELPQRRVVDILPCEPIRLEFPLDDIYAPQAFALRENFPLDLVHTSFLSEDGRRWLCLWEESWADARTRLDPETLVQRLRTWLARTASGENHATGQPLEPLLQTTASTLIVPADVETLGKPLAVVGVAGEGLGMVLRLGEAKPGTGGLNVFAVDAPATVQRAFMRMPRTLADLEEVAVGLGCPFLDRLRAWLREDGRDYDECVLVLLRVPMRAALGEPITQVELRAFSTRLDAAGVGIAMGSLIDGGIGAAPVINLLPATAEPAAVVIDPWRVVHRLDRRAARRLSGAAGDGTRHVVAVGAGAVGSNVVDIASRSGLATWTIVDDDVVLPHNTVRQAQGDRAVGTAKAGSLAALVNARLAEPGIARALVADVSNPGIRASELHGAVDGADLVLDLTASPSALHSISTLPGARRVASLFFGPDGNDLVLLAEPAGRGTLVDEIEAQYFWACATRPELAGHLDAGRVDFVRYANACQDLTRPLPPWKVVALSAIGARELELILTDRTDGSAAMWRLGEALDAVRRLEIGVSPVARCRLGEWTLTISGAARSTIEAERAAALPSETGGVLVGTVDLDRRIVHVTGSVTAPRDSEGAPAFFVRGAEGLRAEVDTLRARSAGMLCYLGEWHSHPTGVPTWPSSDDEALFDHLARMLAPVARPYLMAIAGEAGLWCRLGCSGEQAGEVLWTHDSPGEPDGNTD